MHENVSDQIFNKKWENGVYNLFRTLYISGQSAIDVITPQTS